MRGDRPGERGYERQGVGEHPRISGFQRHQILVLVQIDERRDQFPKSNRPRDRVGKIWRPVDTIKRFVVEQLLERVAHDESARIVSAEVRDGIETDACHAGVCVGSKALVKSIRSE